MIELNPPQRLSNGLEVIINSRPSLHSVGIAIAVRRGSVHETPATNGSSHFAEHMIFEGTRKRTSDDIKEAFIMNRDDFNADTGFETTRLFFNAPVRKAPSAIALLSDMLIDSTFDEKEVEDERGPIVNEILRASDRHQYYLFDTVTSLLFAGQPAGLPIAGETANVLNLSRETLYRIYQEAYTPRAMVVSIFGNINYNTALSLLEENLGRTDRPYNRAELPDAVLPTAFRRVKIKRKGLQDIRASLDFALPGTHWLSANAPEDVVPLRVLCYLLTEQIGDRIERDVGISREHLTNTTLNQMSSFSELSLQFATGLELSKLTEKAVLSEIEKIVSGEITERDFEAARNGFLYTSREILDKPESLSPSIAEDWAVNRLYLGDIYKEVEERLRLEDLHRISQRYLKLERAILLRLTPDAI